MNNLNNLIRNNIRKELLLLKEQESKNYMFFKNIEQIKEQCENILKMNQNEIDNILLNGHDWADDHITVAKEKIDDVFDFLKGEMRTNIQEIQVMDEAKHKPTNPKLWSQCLSWARSRYKVCPSAYCNGAAAKRYKQKGGKWKTEK